MRRYGHNTVSEWLAGTLVPEPVDDTPKPATVPGAPELPPIDRATWGTSPQAIAGHRAMMGEAPKIVKGR